MHQEEWLTTYQELTLIVDPAEHLEFCVPDAQFFPWFRRPVNSRCFDFVLCTGESILLYRILREHSLFY
jgi:hypothetical protein